MTYRVEFHAAASSQIPGLPEYAFCELVSALVKVIRSPWKSMPLRSAGLEHRQVIFGDDGLVTFYVDEAGHVVRVYNVIWTG